MLAPGALEMHSEIAFHQTNSFSLFGGMKFIQ